MAQAPAPRSPDPIQQWIELTQVLIGAASGWAAGDPDQESATAGADIRRIMVMNSALQSALVTAQAARQ